MRSAILKKRNIAAAAIIGLLIALCFAAPCRAFAAENTALSPRHVWFTYGCTDCVGVVHPCVEDYIGYYESPDSAYPEYYSVDMMFCDTNHVVHLAGDGVTGDNVTLTSSNPAVLEIDSEGNVTLKKTGRAEITATVEADDVYAESIVHLGVTVDKHDGWVGHSPVYYAGRSPAWGLELDTSDGPQQLVVPLRPGASVSYSTDDPEVAFVDQDGVVTPVSAGTTQVRFNVDSGGGRYKAGYFYETIKVTGEDLRSVQEITGDKGPFTIDWHDGLALDLQAKTKLEYYIRGSGIATVSKDGFVSFTKAGAAAVRVVAPASKDYKKAEVIINIAARDYAAEEAARIAQEEAERKAEAQAALQTEINKARSLKRPTFKVRALKGRKIKLTWGRVANASGYIVYIKYPGSKKFVKAVKRNSTVKSVTHKGLSKGRVYRYKVRAFKVVRGKTYYGPFSVIRKARAR